MKYTLDSIHEWFQVCHMVYVQVTWLTHDIKKLLEGLTRLQILSTAVATDRTVIRMDRPFLNRMEAMECADTVISFPYCLSESMWTFLLSLPCKIDDFYKVTKFIRMPKENLKHAVLNALS